MLHLETQPSLALHSMPVTRMVFPVVSALEQISLSPVHTCHEKPSTLSLQTEDMITDKEQPAPPPHEVSVCVCSDEHKSLCGLPCSGL